MRKNVIRGLIKEYRNPKTSDVNKEEIKKALKYELSLIIHEPEDNITDYLLEDWMKNEERTETEERVQTWIKENIPDLAKTQVEEGVVFTLPKLNLPKDA